MKKHGTQHFVREGKPVKDVVNRIADGGRGWLQEVLGQATVRAMRGPLGRLE